jgi:DNA-binding cell septation regulator SpoVG
MLSLTLDDHYVVRLLNCLDGQARLPTAMHGFP